MLEREKPADLQMSGSAVARTNHYPRAGFVYDAVDARSSLHQVLGSVAKQCSAASVGAALEGTGRTRRRRRA